jgi:ribokinase
MPARVTVVGSLNMDLVIRTPRIPSPGETIIGSAFQTVPGGKGANQAVAAARLGAQISMVGRVGQDAFGQALLHNIVGDGIDATHVTHDPEAATGVALIVVDDLGENSIVVASGSNMRLSSADVDEAEAAIARASALLLQLENPLETAIRAAEIARVHRVPTILNPAPARSLPRRLLELVDVLVPNESEAALLSNMGTKDLSGAKAAALALRGKGVGVVILTLGEQGALLAGEVGTEFFAAFDVTPVDTTAAGDAFVAGFAVALAEGKPMTEAVRWGNAAGALTVTRLGAQPSLPTRQELELLLAAGATESVVQK